MIWYFIRCLLSVQIWLMKTAILFAWHVSITSRPKHPKKSNTKHPACECCGIIAIAWFMEKLVRSAWAQGRPRSQRKTDELVLTAAPLLRWNLRTAAESAAHSMRGHIRQVEVGFATSQVVGMLWLKLSWYNLELHNHEIDNIWWYEILIDIV